MSTFIINVSYFFIINAFIDVNCYFWTLNTSMYTTRARWDDKHIVLQGTGSALNNWTLLAGRQERKLAPKIYLQDQCRI